MGKLITACPKCKSKTKVINTEYMRLDKGTTVVCPNYSLRFRVVLSNKDIEELFKGESAYPVVDTEEDYFLESEFIQPL